MRKLFYTLTLCSLISGSLFALEIPEKVNQPTLSADSLSPQTLPQENLEGQTTSKNFPFAGMQVFIPLMRFDSDFVKIPLLSAGVSVRKNHHMTDISVHSIGIMNTLSYSASNIVYTGSTNQGPYFSYGIGGYLGNIAVVPVAGVILPFRAGYEGEKGFIDLGVEVNGLYVIAPSVVPEVRAGFKF